MQNQAVWSLAWDALTGMIGRAVLFGVVASVLGIVLVTLLGRKKLFRRDNPVWNGFAKLIYVYVPIVFLIIGGMFGAVRGGQVAANRSVDAVCVYSTKVIPAFKTYLVKNWDAEISKAASLEESAGRFFSQFYFEPETGGYFDRKKAKIINYFSMNAGKWIVVGLATVVLAKAGESVGLDEAQTETALTLIKDLDLSQVDGNFFQIFADALKATVGRWFRGLYIGLGLKLLLLLSIPAIETGVYFLLKRRRTQRMAAV